MGNSRPGGAPATPSSGNAARGSADAMTETPRLRPRGGPGASASGSGSPGRSTPLPGGRERGSPVLANVTKPSSDRQESRAVVEARRLGASPSSAVKKNSVPNSLSRGSVISSGSKRGAEEQGSEQAVSSSKKPKRMDARSYIQRFKSSRRVDASAVVVASPDSMDKENTSSGHVADSNTAILCEGSRLIEKNKGHSSNAPCKVSKSPISGSHETSDTRVDQCSTPFSEVQPHKPTDVQNIVTESSLPAKARDRRTGPARQSFLSSLESAAISTVHHNEIKSTLGDREPISIQKENSSSSSFKVTQSDGTDGNSNLCGACGLGTPGTLRSCDGKGCKSRYHISCLDQYLSPGNWFCASCTKKRLLFGLHHFVDGIESVWDVKEAEGMQNSKQYFVKYKNLAHVHNRWVPEGDIHVMPGGPDLLSLFNKRNHTEKTIWKEEWTKPHRLLRKRLLMPTKLADDSFCSDNFFCSSGVKYTYCSLEWLVKWRGLGYDHATWELETLACLCTPEADELKKNFEDRHEAAKQSSIPPKTKVKQSSFQKLQRLPDGCHPDFDNDHLCSVNHLREYWYKSRGAVLIDDKDYVIRTVLFTVSVLPDVSQPFLILTPPASLSLWEAQFSNLAPFINVVVYAGGKDEFKLIQDLEFSESGSRNMLQVLLSHPDAILEDIEPIARIGWEAVIVDYHEKSALQYLEQLKQLPTDFRMLLVSSPIKDNLPEYVKVLAFLNPGEQENGNCVDTAEALMISEESFKSHIAYERQAGSSKILEHWVPAYISQLQQQIYCSILLSNSSVLQSQMESDNALHDIIMALSKCCDHPYTVDEFRRNAPVNNHDHTDNIDMRVQACGKLLLLQKTLKEIRNKRLRVIILFQSGVTGGSSMGDILESVVCHRFGRDSYERVKHGAPLSKKQMAVNMFNDHSKGRFVFLIESSACLSSIELSSVDAIIIYNSGWNPLNDQKALQRIKLVSQRKHLKIFRLYTPFTVEEKRLVLAKQGMLIGNYKDMTHSVSHSLISWGASFLFAILDELKHDSCASKSSERDTIISEFLKILATNFVGSTKINCTSISEANMSGEFYSRNITLIGEKEEMRALDGDPSDFWLKLLDGKSPCWSYVSEPPQSSHKTLQNMEEPAKVPAEEANETRRKRRKVGEITSSSSRTSPDLMLPENCSTSSSALQPHDDTQQKLGVEKRMNTPKNLHVQLKQELSKLIMALQLPDNVRDMAEQLFDYYLKNHLVVPEPVGILHTLITALCWHAAFLLNHKIDHGESLVLAGKSLNYDCNEELAEFVYAKLVLNYERNEELARFIYAKLGALKKTSPNGAIEASITGQPVSVEDTQISLEQTSTNLTNGHMFQNEEVDHGNFTIGGPQEVSSGAEHMISKVQKPVQETHRECHLSSDELPNMVVEKRTELVDNDHGDFTNGAPQVVSSDSGHTISEEQEPVQETHREGHLSSDELPRMVVEKRTELVDNDHGNFTNGEPREISSGAVSEEQEPVQETHRENHLSGDELPNMIVEKITELVVNDHGNFTNGAPQVVSSDAEHTISEEQEPVQETHREGHLSSDELPNMIVEKRTEFVDSDHGSFTNGAPQVVSSDAEHTISEEQEPVEENHREGHLSSDELPNMIVEKRTELVDNDHGSFTNGTSQVVSSDAEHMISEEQEPVQETHREGHLSSDELPNMITEKRTELVDNDHGNFTNGAPQVVSSDAGHMISEELEPVQETHREDHLSSDELPNIIVEKRTELVDNDHGNFSNGEPREVSSGAVPEEQEPVQETHRECHFSNDDLPNMIVEKRIELIDNVFSLREKNILCKQQLEISGLDTHTQNKVIRLKEVCNLILEHIRRCHIDGMTRNAKIKLTVQWFTMLMYAFLEHMRLQHNKLEALQSDTWSIERQLKENLHQAAKSGQLDQEFDRHIALPDSNFVMEEFIHFKEQNDGYHIVESPVSDNQPPLNDGLLMEITLVRNEVLSGPISIQAMENEPVATSVDYCEGPASEAVDFRENSIRCSSDGMGVQSAGCSSSTIPANDDSVGQESSTGDCRNTEHVNTDNIAKPSMSSGGTASLVRGLNADNDDTVDTDQVHLESSILASSQSLIAIVADPVLSESPTCTAHEPATLPVSTEFETQACQSSMHVEQSLSLPAQQSLATSWHPPAEAELTGILDSEAAQDLQPEVQPSTSMQDQPAEAEQAGTLGAISAQDSQPEMQSSIPTQDVPFLSGLPVLQSPTVHQNVEPSLDQHAGVESPGMVTPHDLQSEIQPSASMPAEQSTSLPVEQRSPTLRHPLAEAECILNTEATCYLQHEVQPSTSMQDQPAEERACILGATAARSVQQSGEPPLDSHAAAESTDLSGVVTAPDLRSEIQPSALTQDRPAEAEGACVIGAAVTQDLQPELQSSGTVHHVPLERSRSEERRQVGFQSNTTPSPEHDLSSEIQSSASMHEQPAEAEGAGMLGTTVARDLQPELQSSATVQHIPLETAHSEEGRQIGFQPYAEPGPEQPTQPPPVTMLVFNNPILSDEPLKNELDRLMRCSSLLSKSHEYKRSQLQIEQNQEIERINRKYESLIQMEDSDYNRRQTDLNAIYMKVYVNKSLAENFRGIFTPSAAGGQGTSTSPAVEQPPESSSSAARIAASPVIPSSSAVRAPVLNSAGPYVRPLPVAQPSSSRAIQLQSTVPANLSGATSPPFVPTPSLHGSYLSGGPQPRAAVQPQSVSPANLYRTMSPVILTPRPQGSHGPAGAAQLRAASPHLQHRMRPTHAIHADQQQHLPTIQGVPLVGQFVPVAFMESSRPAFPHPGVVTPGSAHQPMQPPVSHASSAQQPMPPSVSHSRSSSAPPAFYLPPGRHPEPVWRPNPALTLAQHQQASPRPNVALGGSTSVGPAAQGGQHTHLPAANRPGAEPSATPNNSNTYMPARFGLGGSPPSNAGAGGPGPEVVCLSNDEA